MPADISPTVARRETWESRSCSLWMFSKDCSSKSDGVMRRHYAARRRVGANQGLSGLVENPYGGPGECGYSSSVASWDSDAHDATFSTRDRRSRISGRPVVPLSLGTGFRSPVLGYRGSRSRASIDRIHPG